jgi:putative endonuclease
MNKKNAHVYMLTNRNHTVIYIGVTSDLPKRVYEHRTGLYVNSFTSKYNVFELVYFEEFDNIVDAIMREKQLKAGSRRKKIILINECNPKWEDLFYRLVQLEQFASLRSP